MVKEGLLILSNTMSKGKIIKRAALIKKVIASKGYTNPLAEMLGERPNPFKGMCYVASALLYELFDGEGMTLYRKKDYSGQYHWWIKTDDGDTIDITFDSATIESTESLDSDGEQVTYAIMLEGQEVASGSVALSSIHSMVLSCQCVSTYLRNTVACVEELLFCAICRRRGNNIYICCPR